jgi:hypothetical protein
MEHWLGNIFFKKNICDVNIFDTFVYLFYRLYVIY